MHLRWTVLFLIFISAEVFAADSNSYHCTSVDPQMTLRLKLEDHFSESENMRMGSVTLGEERVQTRVYQFLMPDQQRYIQMWYRNSDFHIDGQFSVDSQNFRFPATLTEGQTRRAVLCYKD